jgi:hypothetical protein
MRSFTRFSVPTLLALLAAPLCAQVQWGGTPPSLGGEAGVRALFGAPPTVAMEPVDVGAYLAEDALAGKDVPFRFGATLPVDLGPQTAGEWTVLPGGDRVWKLRIASDGAYSIGLLFGEYRLPAGASLWIYNDDYSSVLGAYDERNVKEDGQFAIEPVPGDAVTLEYVEPAAVAGQGALRVTGVVHDYRDLYTLMDKSGPGDGGSGACENDVNCPEGAPWQAHKRAITLLIIGGGLCTGSLVNNTANDGTQYYMAAYHCGGLNNAVFRFNYEKTGCGSGTAPINQTVQGSVQLASSSGLDFRLVRVSGAIPASYKPYFLGWNRSGIAPPNTITIHHPEGDVKKISFDNNPPLKSGTQWNIVQWDDGVTEPGSSGCPLLDNTGHFIGQLFGGAATCGFPFDDFYGRFDSAWNSVSPFLDPGATGALSVEGFDPFGGPVLPPVINNIAPPAVAIFQPPTVTLTGTHFGGASTVAVGAVNLSTPGGFQVVTDSSITLTPPVVATLGPQNVTVTTPAGTSNAVQLTYSETLPPKMLVPALVTGGQTLTWQYGGGSLDSAFLLVSASPTTFTVNGSAILSNFFILNTQALPANGLGSFSIVIPPGLAFLTFYSQIVDLQNGTGTLLGATPIASTLIPF